MNSDRFSDAYLYRFNSADDIKRWVNTLKYGYLKRAVGGIVNDGDEFGIWLQFKNRSELFVILNAFGIQLKIIPENHPRPIPGKAYSGIEMEKFKREIKDFPEFEQPLHIEIKTIPCFMWIENGIISMKFCGAKDGNSYEVKEEDFENCVRLEKLIKELELDRFVNRDYEKWIMFITQNHYPELFE